MLGQTVIVIGAGIVGASVAYHLARKGADVTILEASPGAACGVTGKSFGWVGLSNASPIENHDLFLLRSRAVCEFQRLEKEFNGASGKSVHGAIVWRASPEATQALINEHREQGSTVSTLTPGQLSEMEPCLTSIPECAAFFPDAFALEPMALTKLFLDGAHDAGARVHYGTVVERIEPTNGTAVSVHINRECIRSDHVVIANGTDADRLITNIDCAVGIEKSPATLLRLKVEKPIVCHILSGPDFELRHSADGSLLAAERYPDEGKEGLAALAVHLMEVLRDQFGGVGKMHLLSVEAAFRPVPKTGWPCIGSLPGIKGIYVAVAHPGIVFAPLMGRIVAEEIIDGKRDPAIGRNGLFPVI